MKGQIASVHLLLTICLQHLKNRRTLSYLGSNYLEEKQINEELKMIEFLKKKGYSIAPSYQQTA
ncbi:hypothetical protein [Peribacillus butanolivorans]|uniref:hypothetical protein n=1 Tax=Peribacillus butanolivorans TaxID=421767 RepID=UPI00167F3899|nr:hypothetical protein [Peribacillus butanolivorans]QNU05269.1 hypothetical protein GM240_15985 [Peribacillus butanolivorans]